MFLFDRLDFVALVGLWVQAFVAWVFVAILGELRKGQQNSKPLQDFHYAFLALSVALSVMSARFFRAHDVTTDVNWSDGAWLPTACYVAYQGLKAAFGFYLVRGCYKLVEPAVPRWLERFGPPVVVACALTPLLTPSVDDLLALQAPVIVAAAAISLRALARAEHRQQGWRMVRHALWGLIASWCVHAAAATFQGAHPWVRFVLSLNSLIDLAVQLTLGVGPPLSLCDSAAHRYAAPRARTGRPSHLRPQTTLA